MYPKSFEQLIDILTKLPGVGYKTAQRYAFTLLNLTEDTTQDLQDTLAEIRKLKHCTCCGFLTEQERCEICRQERNPDCIIVVSHIQDVVAIEKIGVYKGQYHVLHGNLSSSKGILPQDLNIESLLNRIDNQVQEVILAISPTIDGEMTALYLSKLLKSKDVKVSRFAHGLPMGSSIDYADDLTIIKAMNNRQAIE